MAHFCNIAFCNAMCNYFLQKKSVFPTKRPIFATFHYPRLPYALPELGAGVGKLFRYFGGGFPSRPFIHHASRGSTLRFIPPPKRLFDKAKPL